MEKYGKRHREERQKKLDSMDEARCEVTGKKGHLEADHVVPRLFNGPNHEKNYRMLQSHFHQKILHAACNVNDPKAVGRRVALTKKLQHAIRRLDEEAIAGLRAQIEQLDEYLIDQYIENMMNNLIHKYRDKVFKTTAIASFETIRDLTIESAIKDEIIKAQEEEIQRLRESLAIDTDAVILEPEED